MQGLTSETAAVLFLDLQAEIVKNSSTVPVDRLRRAAGVLAKLAALHGIPAYLSGVPSVGPYLDEVCGPLSTPQPHYRTFTTAFADDELVAFLREYKRGVLLISGVASEIVVQRTALDALAAGYQVHLAVDACGGISTRTEEAAWRRIIAAGGITTSVTTIAAELAGDFTTKLGGETLNLMYETLGA